MHYRFHGVGFQRRSQVHSHSHTRRLAPACAVARMIVAAVLALALLSGIAPLSTASSAHMCIMSCCVGKPPHEAGSCGMSLSNAEHAEAAHSCETVETAEALSEHAGMMDMHGMQPETVATADHCDTDEHSAPPHRSSTDHSQQSSGLAFHALQQPCPPDCRAGACGFSAFRRSRDSAALAHAVKPRPPTSVRDSRGTHHPVFIASAWRRPILPRGPPLSAFTLR